MGVDSMFPPRSHGAFAPQSAPGDQQLALQDVVLRAYRSPEEHPTPCSSGKGEDMDKQEGQNSVGEGGWRGKYF